ncbi:hypothetical protein GLAREA_11188 [Glarea lozoyensis ATCC 20868]|uniref:CFEM domain-containing protein n=1 Tax=Glarea lozoyensis (strain ATCC 20868 / MF5171) TaxID=1116229 RepID=S3DEE5_GLAL2|nr:uncharacterized protein GLAREA_11188 [Glarea lozoyensis ATCC 20868]EPE35489.1 hypothetical protein GLAREA_11188 [Glarea lozoyensis ATCC 20868]
MKVTFVATLLALANLASAQLDGIPACARPCVTAQTSGSNIGGCPSLDITCICSNPSFLSTIACCLSDVCSAADQKTATDFARNFCGIAGVTNLPTAVTCSTGASASSTSAAGSSGTSAPTAASGNGTNALSSAVSSVSSRVSSATNSAASATGTSGAQRVVGVGAGILGGLAAGVALL